MAAKNTKKTDLSSLDDAALASRIVAEKADLQRSTFSHAIAAIENPMSLRVQRRGIAQLLTEQTARKNKA
jgi:large subunit ribosomal protein L29